MNASPAKSGGPPRDPSLIEEADLKRIPDIHALLQAFHDPYTSSKQIADLVEKIPVLKARCEERVPAGRKRPDARMAEILTVIGNRTLEEVLLGLLEDLTLLKAELEGGDPLPKLD
ncbi:MAG: hypothetical protein ACO3JL_00595 [Myxococcota bacterium]